MTWGSLPNAQPDPLRAVQEWALEIFLYYRNRGHARAVAMQQTSLALRLTPRKTRSVLEQEPAVAIRREEYEQARSAFLQHLVERERELISRSEAARKRRADIQHQEGLECSGQLSLNFSNGDGTRHSGASIDTKRHISTRNVAR